MRDKRCYSVKEVQEILGVSRPAVYDLLKRNEFRWVVVAGKYRIPKAGFDAWLDGPSPEKREEERSKKVSSFNTGMVWELSDLVK